MFTVLVAVVDQGHFSSIYLIFLPAASTRSDPFHSQHSDFPKMAKEVREYTLDEVKTHQTKKDLWVVIHGKGMAVYPVTHPHNLLIGY